MSGLIRHIVKWLWINALQVSGLMHWAKWRLAKSRAVLVITLHRVLTDEQCLRTHSQPEIVTHARNFEAMVEHIHRVYGFVAFDGNATPAHRDRTVRFALTFDDGWLDTYINAFPIARRYSAPFTVFICPGLMAQQYPFWPERVQALWDIAERNGRQLPNEVLTSILAEAPRFTCSETMIDFLKTLATDRRNQVIAALEKHYEDAGMEITWDPIDATVSWDNAAEMADEKVTFGSHTVSHTILTNVPVSLATREARESKRMIEQRLRKPCLSFAYPNGNSSVETQNMLAEAGYTMAFATPSGAWLPETNPLAIPRLSIYDNKICDSSGKFSRFIFDYVTFWAAYTALWRRPTNRDGIPASTEPRADAPSDKHSPGSGKSDQATATTALG